MSTQSITQQHAECEKPKKQSIGETIWHDFTYNGVNYAANLAVSLVLWDFFTAGKGKFVKEGLNRGIEKSLISNGTSAESAAFFGENISHVIFSPLGGHFMMIPVKYLEDHARYFTHRINQTLDPKYKFKQLQATMDTPETELPSLSDEPTKQTWGQIAIRRTLAWGAVVGAGVFIAGLRGGRYQKVLQDETKDFITWGMEQISTKTNTEGLTKLSKNDTFKRYLDLFALDAYFTVITSGVTEATKSWFSKDKNGNGAKHANVSDIAAASPVPAVNAVVEMNKDTPSPEITQLQQVQQSHHASNLDATSALTKQTSFVNALQHRDRGTTEPYQTSA